MITIAQSGNWFAYFFFVCALIIWFLTLTGHVAWRVPERRWFRLRYLDELYSSPLTAPILRYLMYLRGIVWGALVFWFAYLLALYF